MTTTAPITATPAPNGNDFADWLSPILVKELRQGLKSRAFVATFIIVQVGMILLVGFQLLTVAGGGERVMLNVFDGFFWAVIWIAMLVLMPARGLTAVSEEVKANTLDLVQLTRLSAFRIVFGKWIALVSQTLLLVAAILPYAVLRYFFGEVDVVKDMTNIGLLLLVSLALTAGAIALSSVHLAVRIIVLLVLFPTLLTGVIPMMVMRAVGGGSFTSFAEWGWMVPVFTAVYTYLMLEIAAARIAPVSENHAAPKRLLALGLTVVAVILGATVSDEKTGVWMVGSSLVCGWVMLEALCERTVMVPSMYASFARRGVLGRLAGRVLYPGWASGLVFCALITLLLVAVFWIVGTTHHAASWREDRRMAEMVFPIFFASMISPVAVLRLFPRVKQPVWLYILVQAVFALIYLIATIAAETPDLTAVQTYRWVSPFPTSTLFALLDEGQEPTLRKFFMMVSLPVCAVIVVYLALMAVKEFRAISLLERASLGGKPDTTP